MANALGAMIHGGTRGSYLSSLARGTGLQLTTFRPQTAKPQKQLKLEIVCLNKAAHAWVRRGRNKEQEVCPVTKKGRTRVVKETFSGKKSIRFSFNTINDFWLWWERGQRLVFIRMSDEAYGLVHQNGLEPTMKKAGIDLWKRPYRSFTRDQQLHWAKYGKDTPEQPERGPGGRLRILDYEKGCWCLKIMDHRRVWIRAPPRTHPHDLSVISKLDPKASKSETMEEGAIAPSSDQDMSIKIQGKTLQIELDDDDEGEDEAEE